MTVNKENTNFTNEHYIFLKKYKRKKFLITFFQFIIFALFIFLWELLSRYNIIDPFLLSSPSRIFQTIITLNNTGELWSNIFYTLCETIVGFLLGTIIGILIAILLWWFEFIQKISEPYLVIFNALPKVALGPIIIVWMGSGAKSIITMALLISVIVSTINMLSGFQNVDNEKLLLMKSFGATKIQILKKIILPYNVSNIISTLKINVGMSLIGVITGEFLVATKGIGYLIIYGGQIFNLDLVMTGIFILAVIASLMYIGISKIESKYK